jgi:hypothetical protein
MTENKEKKALPQILWEIEVRDKTGKLLKHYKTPARSWLKGFIQILKGEFATRCGAAVGGGNVSIVDEGGTARSYPYQTTTGTTYGYWINLSTLGDVGDTSQGIIVGTTDTPNSLTTYALGGKIAHGSGSGQLVYNAETVEDVTNPSGNDLQFRLTRTFTNNSGATITVKEVGLLIKKIDSGQSVRSFLAARDVLPSPVDVPDGATLTIRYVVKITVA